MDINDKVFIVLYNLILNIDNKTFNKLKNLNIYKKKREEINNIYYIIIICFISIITICIMIYIFYYKKIK
jgi:hypothetical protein